MKEKIKTLPDLLETAPFHKEAIANGNDHFRLWERNVADKYKSLPDEDIKADLKSTAFPYAVCFENWINDFNIASGIRNANAFNAKEVYYLGNKKIDRRGMCGVHNYTDVKWIPTIDEFLALKDKYVFVGVDNIDNATALNNYSWKHNSMMIFGSEGVGLTPAMISMCDDFVYIKQFGSVRSLNAATASGIIMNDYVTKFSK